MGKLTGFAAAILSVLPGAAAFAHTSMQPHMHELSPIGALVAGLAALGYVIALAYRLLAARRPARAPRRKRER